MVSCSSTLASLLINYNQQLFFARHNFQVEDVDAVTVSLAISKAKKQLNSVQKKEVDKLQTLRHHLDKIDNDKYQGVELLNLETAKCMTH